MLIQLPFPAKILWPNGRRHWAAKHRAFQKHKEWARLATLAWLSAEDFRGRIAQPLQWSATFYPKTAHKIDDDNARASLKAFQDGIAAALKFDDKYFAAPTIHFAQPVKNGRVIITIGEAGA